MAGGNTKCFGSDETDARAVPRFAPKPARNGQEGKGKASRESLRYLNQHGISLGVARTDAANPYAAAPSPQFIA